MITGEALRAPVHSPHRRRRGKRIFDVAVAGTGLLLLAPLMAIVWVAIRVSTPGPGLFRQVRVGRHRRTFVMYKFRTMYDGCPDDIHREYVHKLLIEENPPVGGRRGLYKLEDDPRITRIGRVLRRTSLDELPQLINVVKGDMSLVGPRPALPWEADLFGSTDHPRFLVPPGVTGLWQVSGRSRVTMHRGLELDIEYVSRQSFALDLLIVMKTVPAVLSAGGSS